MTLKDYADDAVAAVKWLAKRKDVDTRRIFAIGHSEGAAVAMLAANEKEEVAGLVLMAGMGTSGRELILRAAAACARQREGRGPGRTAKVDLQKRISRRRHRQGFGGAASRSAAIVDTPLYRSVLLFDPEQAMSRVKQPFWILRGALDKS